MDVVRHLAEARWVVLAWQNEAGDWQRFVRGPEEIFPQTRERFLQELESCGAHPAPSSSEWQSFLSAWRAETGIFLTFNLRPSQGAYYAVIGDLVLESTSEVARASEWIRVALQAMIRAASGASSAQAQLVEAARPETLIEVAAAVAHDFNNVLGALLGRVQLLQHSLSDPEVRGALAKMEWMIGDGEAVVKRLQEAVQTKSCEA